MLLVLLLLVYGAAAFNAATAAIVAIAIVASAVDAGVGNAVDAGTVAAAAAADGVNSRQQAIAELTAVAELACTALQPGLAGSHGQLCKSAINA